MFEYDFWGFVATGFSFKNWYFLLGTLVIACVIGFLSALLSGGITFSASKKPKGELTDEQIKAHESKVNKRANVVGLTCGIIGTLVSGVILGSWMFADLGIRDTIASSAKEVGLTLEKDPNSKRIGVEQPENGDIIATYLTYEEGENDTLVRSDVVLRYVDNEYRFYYLEGKDTYRLVE